VGSQRDLDFLDPQALQRPFAFYDRVRKSRPVYKLPVSPIPGKEVFLVTSYDLVRSIGQDWRSFSNQFGFMMNQAVEDDDEIGAILADGHPWMDTLLTQDPPIHRQYRNLVARAFGPTRIRRMSDYIEGLCDELIDGFIARGECDFFADFAVPLPIYVMADQLGVARADLPFFKQLADDYIRSIGGMYGREGALKGARALVAIQQYFAKVIEARRGGSTDDVVGELVNARLEDGTLVEVPVLLSLLHQLLIAGSEAPRNAAAGGIAHILQTPGLKDRLLADPSLMGPVVEEILRLEAPTKNMWRVVVHDTEIGGVSVPAGAILLLSYDAGNHDPAEFPRPNHFDPARPNLSRHLAFGGGIHFCIGSQLARKELAIAFDRLLTRLPNLRLTEGLNPLEYAPSILHRAFTSLHLSFDACPAHR